MLIGKDEKIDFIKLELDHLQGALNKYDDLIFRNRNFFITMWLGCQGLAFTIKSEDLPLLGVVLAFIYWFFEGMIRYKYTLKYISRFRKVRNSINSKDFRLDSYYPIYDLSDHFEEETLKKPSISDSFFKLEPILVYVIIGTLSMAIWILSRLEYISL